MTEPTIDHLKELSEIRQLMERSSRFISLSGLSGIAVGIVALIGSGIACWHLGFMPNEYNLIKHLYTSPNSVLLDNLTFLAIDAMLILFSAILLGIYFTKRNAKKKSVRMWDATTRRLLLNLFIPLAAGGVFCLILLQHGILYLIAPATLIFYGLALVNASKYTLNDIKYLGFCEIGLGLLSAYFYGYGMVSWMVGFGLLHIVYGTVMYYKYER